MPWLFQLVLGIIVEGREEHLARIFLIQLIARQILLQLPYSLKGKCVLFNDLTKVAGCVYLFLHPIAFFLPQNLLYCNRRNYFQSTISILIITNKIKFVNPFYKKEEGVNYFCDFANLCYY